MIKQEKDGCVAVLISRGYGAGWYSWNRDLPELLFDPYIVNLLLQDSVDKDKIEAYMALKYPGAYTGGMQGLAVAWVPKGTRFRVDEYDGAESVVLESDEQWFTA